MAIDNEKTPIASVFDNWDPDFGFGPMITVEPIVNCDLDYGFCSPVNDHLQGKEE